MQPHKQRDRSCLVLLFFATTIVAANQSPFVSSGTCYFAAGEEADSAYIPCGNDAFGVYACCMNGDNCLSSSACYNAEYGNVYIAGCTDPTYSDAACGDKGVYGELEWASLVRCFVSNDTTTNDEEWAACEESNQPLVTKHDGECVCTASAHTAAFTDNPTLTNLAILPDATDKSISFQPGHTPPSDLTPISLSANSPTTISSTLEPTTTSQRGGSLTASTIDSAPTSISTDVSTPESLSTAAEAGIGVGAGLGVLLACAVLFLLYRRRLKKQFQLQGQVSSKESFMSPTSDHNGGWSSSGQAQHLLHGADPSRTGSMRSPAWSGYKSELPTTEQRVELNGSTQPSSLAVSPDPFEIDGVSTMSRTYERTSPYTSSDVPTWTGTNGTGTYQSSNSQPTTSTRAQTVHELPGSYT